MKAKLIIKDNNPAETFKSFTFWGGGYYSALYLDLELLRPSTEVFQELDEDQEGDKEVLFESVIVKDSFHFLVIPPLLSFLSRANLHSIIEIEDLETNTTYTVKNLTITDLGDENSLLGTVKIDVENKAAVSGCENDFTLIACP